MTVSTDLRLIARMMCCQPLTNMERMAVCGKLHLIADTAQRMETRYVELAAVIERIADPVDDEPETSVRRAYLSVVGD